MPLYEYVCQKCHHGFEYLVRSGEQPVCPECQSRELAKQLSVVAAHSTSGESAAAEGCGLPQCGSGRCGFESL